MKDNKGRDAAWHATHSGHGKNKLIAQLLNIRDNGRNRRITAKLPSQIPSITVASPKFYNPSPTQQLKATAAPFVPETPTASSYLSPFHYPSCFQHISKAPSRNSSAKSTATVDSWVSSTTPLSTKSDHSASHRKRKLMLSPSRDIFDRSSSSDTDVLSLSPNSQPLPETLEDLLDRIDLPQFKKFFDDCEIELEQFLVLSESDLIELGIKELIHRRKLVLAQMRYRDGIAILPIQESFYADFLLNQNRELTEEVNRLKTFINDMKRRRFNDAEAEF
jgi:hypothetical protein